jgi:hypothetical protein
VLLLLLESTDLTAYHDLGPPHFDCRINSTNVAHNKKTFTPALSLSFFCLLHEPLPAFNRASHKEISFIKPNPFFPLSPRSPPHNPSFVV